MEQAVGEKIQKFFSQYKKVTYKEKETVIRATDRVFPIHYIQNGMVRQYATTEDGEDITLTVFKPGSFFPIMLGISNKPNKYYFETLTETTINEVPLPEVLIFLKREPDVLFDLSTRFAEGINGLLTKIENLSYKSASYKLISLLIYVADKFGKKEGNNVIVTIPLTHTDLASWIGVQRETVSREMEKLKSKGILHYNKNIILIQDLHLLKNELENASYA